MDSYNTDNQTQQNEYSTEVVYTKSHKKLKIVLVGAVVLILLAVLAYLLFFTEIFTFRKSGVGNDTETTQQNISTGNSQLKSLRVVDEDMDNDGLLDEDEEKLGTSNQEFDTDRDGIPDKLEIEKYNTDPTKFDTDGDSFGDGYEIIHGYNPLGEGRL